MIEKDFDIPFIADQAFREKQIQQSYRPIIAVHKWFARRPGTLFRGLLLSEFVDSPLREAFYQSTDLSGMRIADPFMGGGTPIVEANRIGCSVTGMDINPMAHWIVKEELTDIDLAKYREAASNLREELDAEIGHLYRTRCVKCGSPEAHTKYRLWVKVISCVACGSEIDLFPGYLVAADSRHPLNVLVCPACGRLNEVADRRHPGRCSQCATSLRQEGPARRGRCECPSCGTLNSYPRPELGAPRHRLFAIEYHCPDCRPTHKGRFFKEPDESDFRGYSEAGDRLDALDCRYVPDETIPSGDESDRLLRWGYKRYKEMFNSYQLLGLELSARAIAATEDERIRSALATNLSDLVRYQNMLCRYDSRALKSLDIFSVHGFPVGLIQCESNILGICKPGQNSLIGSGGWANIVSK